MLRDSAGRISLRALIWILILSSAGYTGYKLSYPYFSYYMLKTDVEEELKLAHMYTENTLRKRIAKKAATWNVPVRSDDIIISRDFENLTITVDYSETVTFLGRYKKRLNFHIKAVGPVREPARMLK